MIGPVNERMARVDARALQAFEPATTFDALRAAGDSPPVLVPGPTPIRGEGPMAIWGRRLRAAAISPVELTDRVLRVIESENPQMRAFITVDPDGARRAAAAAEQELRRGIDRGPLHGIPIAVKDIVETAGLKTTGGSRLRADHIPARDAFIVRRLRMAGAIIVGKANTHEFAAGGTGENPHYGTARNPWDPERVPGGSSSGSGVALAAGLVFGAIGTDTGGSVRIPAACCGVVGLKPTYGRVSRAGVFPLAWSLDHIGPMAMSVGDAAAMLGAIAGLDPEDGTSAAWPVPDFGARLGEVGNLRGVRLGVPSAWLATSVQPGVRTGFECALRALASMGAELRECELPDPESLAPINRAIAFAEATAYHWADLNERPTLYGEDVRARKEAGRHVTGVQYLQAQRLRAELCRRVGELLRDQVDFIATPTLPIVAPKKGGAGGYGGDLIRFTAFVNLLGLPALSVPCALEGGLPVGLQLIGRCFREADLLRVGAAYEQARGAWPAAPGAVSL
ncbi:MAG TPA: amidase [Bacillota bacterium]|nr:amidase [Bacillota bacterium]